MTQTPPRTRGRPHDESLTPAIMLAVIAELAESGYATLTTAAVARRAGVSTATLYRRWPSKRDLLLSAAELIASPEDGDVDTGSTRDDLCTLIGHKQRMLSGPIGVTVLSLIGESAHDDELAAILRTSLYEPSRAHLAAVLDRAAVERGEDVRTDADAATRLVLGGVLSSVAFGDGGGLSDDDADLLVDALLSPTLTLQPPTGDRRTP
ncbi:MAG: TetR/AcrR family transcriptional regulator [Gordonia sp. (in: high G+C Gram-positive bacteria)]